MSTRHVAHVPAKQIEDQRRCEFERSLRGAYCAEMGEVRLDGLHLCQQHAARLRLEEQAACWGALLLHTDLWTEEARRRDREDLARSLEAERAKIAAVLGRVRHSLERTGAAGSGRDTLSY